MALASAFDMLSDDDAIICDFFSRYDLDGSGTLNSQEEFYKVTLNLLMSQLKRRKPPRMTGKTITVAIEALLTENEWVDFDDNHAYGLQQFRNWFNATFPSPTDAKHVDNIPFENGAVLEQPAQAPQGRFEADGQADGQDTTAKMETPTTPECEEDEVVVNMSPPVVMNPLREEEGDGMSTFGRPSQGKGNSDAIIRELFVRYDMDNSGNINSTEELHQLTTNVLFALSKTRGGPGCSQEEAKHKMDSVGELNDSNAWSVEEYIVWFQLTFEGVAPAAMPWAQAETTQL